MFQLTELTVGSRLSRLTAACRATFVAAVALQVGRDLGTGKAGGPPQL